MKMLMLRFDWLLKWIIKRDFRVMAICFMLWF